jgi:hypothetical protein
VKPADGAFAAILLICTTGNIPAQEKYIIPPCAESSPANKLIGGQLKLLIPKGVIVRRAADADYESYSVGYRMGKKIYWLSGIYGPHATDGTVPKQMLEKSVEVESRTWKRDYVDGVDAKGKLPNGNLWRYIGQISESVTYENVPAEAASFFDRILNKVCYSPRVTR